MPNILKLIAENISRVTANDVIRHFSDAIEIRDAQAFADELDAFIREWIGSIELIPDEISSDEGLKNSFSAPDRNASVASDFERVIEMLIYIPGLDRDQLEQGRLHAAERRKLIEQLHFLSAGELAQLMPEQLESEGDDVSDAVRNVVDTHQLIRVLIRGEWRYPALQIDPATSALYQPLQPLIKGARDQGYIDWEILSWLVRPYCLPDNTPGQDPLPDNKNASLQEIVDAIKARHRQQPAAEEPISPIDLLRTGDIAMFETYASYWLGHQYSIAHSADRD